MGNIDLANEFIAWRFIMKIKKEIGYINSSIYVKLMYI